MHKLFLYNSLSNKKEIFTPINPNNIRIYACGPTVYNYAHIGNARMAVVFDLLARLLRFLYPRVTYVSNITDIDDKIIDRSLKERVHYETITNKFTKIYNQDMAALNVLKPDIQPKATEFVEKMIEKVAYLQQKGFAYESNKHLLFKVSSFPKYGSLAKRIKTEQIAGSRVDVAEYKENPEDFVLWKPSGPKEPGWQSPWGYGRPGWHTECFVMSIELLGMPFDIHGGGIDLKFPHHDNEIAQACCFAEKVDNASNYAKYWLHNGFVTIDKDKMSKSLGNFKLVKDCLQNYDGEVIRLALLSTHYRSPLSWSDNLLKQSKKILTKIYKFLDANNDVNIDKKENIKLPVEVEKALFDDLNLSKVFSFLNKLISKAPTHSEEKNIKKIKETLFLIGDILGILQKNPNNWLNGKKKKIEDEEEVKNLIAERAIARKNKDFEKADKIRDKLLDLGVELKDTKILTTDN